MSKDKLTVVRDEPAQAAIDLAIRSAQGSKCVKSKRGVAILGANGGLVSSSNKPATGACDGSEACRAACRFRCIHAEAAAIVLAIASRNCTKPAQLVHVKVTSEGVLTSSGPPSCAGCATLILAYDFAGIWLLADTGWKWYPAAEFYVTTMRNLGHKED